jgi:hypothetical protein
MRKKGGGEVANIRNMPQTAAIDVLLSVNLATILD